MSKLYKEGYYESEEFSEPIYIPIELEDGTEQECEVLAIFPVKDKQYAALLPLEEEAEDIYLYRFRPVGKEEFELEDIIDDEEYEAVVDVFDMLLDDTAFEDMLQEEEEEF